MSSHRNKKCRKIICEDYRWFVLKLMAVPTDAENCGRYHCKEVSAMGGQTNNTMGTVGPNHPSASDAPVQQASGVISSWPTNAIEWARFIHRLLRGRYRRASIVVLAYAAIGGLGGWLLTPTLYRSDGMVRIASKSCPLLFKKPIKPARVRCSTRSCRPSTRWCSAAQ